MTGIPRRGGHGGEGRDARDDLERHAGLGERERLLAAAAEDERVAALQPDDLEPAPPELDEQPVDRLLAQPVPRRSASASAGASSTSSARDERVVDEHVARAHELEPAHGDQPRVAGAGADEVDGHRSASSTSRCEVLAPLLVRREVRLRPGPQLAQLAGELGVLRPDDRRDLVAEALRERGRGAAGRDGDRDRVVRGGRRGG